MNWGGGLSLWVVLPLAPRHDLMCSFVNRHTTNQMFASRSPSRQQSPAVATKNEIDTLNEKSARTTRIPPIIRFTCLWGVAWCVKAMHHAVHSTSANILDGVHRRKMNGPPVINCSVEVPDQVQVKKRNEECNKRDATVLEKLKASSVEDIILDESKTQILSIAGVEYVSLSAKVR